MLLAHLDCKVNALGWMRVAMNEKKKQLDNLDAVEQKLCSSHTSISMGFAAFCSQCFRFTLIQKKLGPGTGVFVF